LYRDYLGRSPDRGSDPEPTYMTHPESHLWYQSVIHPTPLTPLPAFGHGLLFGQAGGGVPRKAGEVGV
jgi:hypothetical protein